MRTRKFEIPQNIIPEFFQYAEQTELEVKLIGVNEDDVEDTLEVEITYDDKERKEVMNLIELIDDYLREQEELEEEENGR